MNPYEKYYLRKKLVTAAIAVGAVAAIGGGVLLWQPWNAETPDAGDEQQQLQQQPEEDTPVEKKEPDLTITVGGKKLECFLYRGDGWTIPYPMDWTVEEDGSHVRFIPPGSSGEDSCLTVTLSDKADYAGSFIAVGDETFASEEPGMKRLFYHGGSRGYAVTGRMTDEDREVYEKTMTAMARTMTVGSERPFASLYPMASEPEWQVVDGDVILFLDKDGVDMESVAEQAVKARMSSWEDSVKVLFTGKYRFGTPRWNSSYTCVSEDYVDVFSVEVQYQVVSGKADELVLEDGQMVRDGWLVDENAVLYIAVFHDGSVVTNRVSAWGDEEYFGAKFAAEVLK